LLRVYNAINKELLLATTSGNIFYSAAKHKPDKRLLIQHLYKNYLIQESVKRRILYYFLLINRKLVLNTIAHEYHPQRF
jgi:hypothetical protein